VVGNLIMGGSSGGLSTDQMAQLQAMLKATKAPASIFAPLNAAQQKNYTTLTGFVKAGTKLNATQTARLAKFKDIMASSQLLKLGAAPERSDAFGLAQDARFTLMKRQGYKATVATSPLGDAGFGTSLSKPVLTGQTA
jgi:hypothetical protein